jgi:hypothetical protein
MCLRCHGSYSREMTSSQAQPMVAAFALVCEVTKVLEQRIPTTSDTISSYEGESILGQPGCSATASLPLLLS